MGYWAFLAGVENGSPTNTGGWAIWDVSPLDWKPILLYAMPNGPKLARNQIPVFSLLLINEFAFAGTPYC